MKYYRIPGCVPAILLATALLTLTVFSATQARTGSHTHDEGVLSAETLWHMSRLGTPVISPDGAFVVAPVTRYTIEDDQSHTDLWLFASDGSVERPLTRHGSAEGQPVFSPDGRYLAFVARREGDSASQLYIMPLQEPGEARRFTEVPTGVLAPKWVGENLYFISRVWPEMSWDEMDESLAERRNSHDSAHAWNRLPFSHWDHWLDEERQAHIYRIGVSGFLQSRSPWEFDTALIEAVTLPTGRELPRSSQGSSTYDVAPDESLVVFVSDTNSDDVNPKMDLWAVVPGQQQVRNLTEENDAPDGSPLFSPDGSLLAFTRQHIKGFYADTRRLMIHEVATGRTNEITGSWDRSADGLVWAPDNRTLYGAIDDAGTRRVYAISTRGGQVRAVTAETDVMSLSMAQDGTLAALNQSFLYPPRLVLVDTRRGTLQRLDTFNDEILEGIELGTYESVTYEGYDGEPIQMWVHYPPGFDPEKKYPLFLLIHGGPHNAITDGFHFRWNAQTFASWGYVTAWHNFHGSSGFGQRFADSINPDWITRPYADTRKAAEWFAGQPWIDTERMVAGGGSYGGYLSSILLGREHPFNALLIHAPVYNMYSQMAADFAVHTTRFGDYWDEDNDIYKQISPHYFAGDFNTPALIIHGQLDYRVPVGQAFELFRTLQHRGIESRLVYYPDENHWILKPNNSLRWYDEVRQWISRFAEPGPR